MIKTFSFRIKDSSCFKHLEKHARSVNFVWNFCNETQRKAVHDRRKWLSEFDLNYLLKSTSKEIHLNAGTILQVSKQYVQSRTQQKKSSLRWRGKKSLGWIPLKAKSFQLKDGAVVYLGKKYKLWKSRPIEGKILDGSSFSQDARGRWYINIVCECEETIHSKKGSVGVDLGLKTIATCSTGRKFDAQQFFRKCERKLAHHQRCHNGRQVKTIHAKIANSRKDFNHKISHELTRDFDIIIIGDVSSSHLMKTKLAKSITDAAWGQLRSFVKYKAIARGGTYHVVNEYNTTRTCSCCGSLSGPTGQAGLRVRTWTCSDCNITHDRDVNAAINIEQTGLQQLQVPLGVSSAEVSSSIKRKKKPKNSTDLRQ